MTRVSENSSTAAINFSVGKAKSKLEDLQLKGSTLKSINRPSDNPINNLEYLSLSSSATDNKQYTRNANFALLNLNATEQALEKITDLLVKAKELAVGQASDIYNGEVRKNISNEVIQLRNETLVIANKRIGNKYIFGGYSTLKAPFNKDGDYRGDRGQMSLEVAKDFFVPINLNGIDTFYADGDQAKLSHPLEDFSQMQHVPKYDVAVNQKDEKITKEVFSPRNNIFSQLNSFIIALETNDSKLIQDLLEQFDSSISRLVTLRTRVGSITNSVESAITGTEKQNIDIATRKSQISDADVAELFSDIQKQQQILKTTYQAGKATLNNTLMDFVL